MKKKIGLIITFSEEKVGEEERKQILAKYLAALIRWDMEEKKKMSESSNPLDSPQ